LSRGQGIKGFAACGWQNEQGRPALHGNFVCLGIDTRSPELAGCDTDWAGLFWQRVRIVSVRMRQRGALRTNHQHGNQQCGPKPGFSAKSTHLARVT